MKKIKVAVIFGGTNTEHEISIITALQAMHALKEYGHQAYPIYISKQGSWHLGNDSLLKPETYRNLNQITATTPIVRSEKREGNNLLVGTNVLRQEKVIQQFDVALPIFHGKYGEDGTIQGFLKLLGIPLAGSTLLSTSIGIDKWVSKRIAASLGIPVIKDVLITHASWKKSPQAVIENIHKTLGKNVIIKPSMLGSSIGIKVVHDAKSLEAGLKVALLLDHRIVVEQLLPKPMEVQISIMGNDPYELSVTEQPLSSETVYSYEDKYIKGRSKKTGASKGMASASRRIPAPISTSQDQLIRAYSEKFYRTIGAKGLSRIDYLIDGNTVYFNEINVIPGSLAFYLWEKSGKPFPELMNQLVEMALESHQEEQSLIKSFESNVLANFTLPD